MSDEAFYQELLDGAAKYMARLTDWEMTHAKPEGKENWRWVEVDGKFELHEPPVPTEPTYVATDLFCPHCGEKKVLVLEDSGEYDRGPFHRCEGCHAIFHLD